MSARAPVQTSGAPWRLLRAGAVYALAMLAGGAMAQSRLERGGIALYWGLVPAAVVSQQHAIDELHGGLPIGGGKVNHLVVALFDAKTGRRIDQAIVRTQMSESGVVDGAAKYLSLMTINDQASFGQLFGMVGNGPYRFRVTVQLPGSPREIEFLVSAMPALTQP